MTYMDPEVEPNEVRVSRSVWRSWRFTKQVTDSSKSPTSFFQLLSVKVAKDANGVKRVFPLVDSSNLRASQILNSNKHVIVEEPEEL